MGKNNQLFQAAPKSKKAVFASRIRSNARQRKSRSRKRKRLRLLLQPASRSGWRSTRSRREIGPCRPAERLRCKGCRARVSVCPRALQAAPGGDLRAAGAELAPAGLQSGFGMRATGPGVQASLGAFLHFNGRYRSSLGRAAVCLECFEAITRQVGGPVIEAWAGKLSELICVLSAQNPAESLLLEAKDV